MIRNIMLIIIIPLSLIAEEMEWIEWPFYEPSNKNCLFYDAVGDEIHLGNPVAYIRLSDDEVNVTHWMPLPPKPE